MTDIACVVQSGDSLGESVIWCPRTRKVWWLDILKPCLQSFDPASGAHQVYPLPGPNCGCAALRASGGFVLAMDNGLHGFDPETGRLDFLFHPEPEPPTNRYNDGRCDRRGRFWLGTMDCDIRGPTRQFLPARRRPLGRGNVSTASACRTRPRSRPTTAPCISPIRRGTRSGRSISTSRPARSRTGACSPISPRARACRTAPASMPKAFSGTPSSPASA